MHVTLTKMTGSSMWKVELQVVDITQTNFYLWILDGCFETIFLDLLEV